MGLFDVFNTGEGRTILGLLAAAGARPGPRNTGGGLLGALNEGTAWEQTQQDRASRTAMQALQADLMRAQIGETQAQARQRDAQSQQMANRMALVQQWLGQSDDALAGANTATARATGNLAPTVGNAAVQRQALEQRQQSNPLFGIPRQAIDADLAFNEGKGISDMLFKRGTPNPQVHNGIVLDMNRVPSGTTLPTISQNGQASQPIADPNAPGGFRIIAPQGAAEVYSTYRQADERAKADTDLVKVFNPGTGREEYVTRSQAIERAQPARSSGGVGGGTAPRGGEWRVDPSLQASRDVERLRILREELQRANTPEDRAALQREIGRMGNASGAGGAMAAGPSTREAALADYDRGVQKDLVERRRTILDAAEAAGPRLANLQQLGGLLSQHDGGALSPTGLQIARAANSLGLKIDPQLGNKEAAVALTNQMALELRNPSGGAGMPGALSDGDRQFLSNMVPGLATSAEGRATMIRAASAVEQRKQQVAQFARNYEAKYGRLDNGFFDQLASWSRVNPLFDRRGGQ